jgi:hypothetical protein
MNHDLVSYLFEHYSYLAPIEVKGKIKYPYLNEFEKELEKEKIAKYLVDNFFEKLLINNCPSCRKLARTPKAKQCSYCGHHW